MFQGCIFFTYFEASREGLQTIIWEGENRKRENKKSGEWNKTACRDTNLQIEK